MNTMRASERALLPELETLRTLEKIFTGVELDFLCPELKTRGIKVIFTYEKVAVVT